MKNLTVRVAAEEVAADDPEADDLVADDRSKETAAAVEAMIIDRSRETAVKAVARAMMAPEEARGPGMTAVKVAVAASRGNKGVMAAGIAVVVAAAVVGVLKERIARLNRRFRGCVCIFCRMKRG